MDALEVFGQGARGKQGSLTTPRLVTLKEVSATLSISLRTLQKWVAAKRLPHYKLGRAVRCNLEEVSAWLAKKKV